MVMRGERLRSSDFFSQPGHRILYVYIALFSLTGEGLELCEAQ